MAEVDSLLGVLRRNDGDELILGADKSPQLLSKGRSLKLFLRPVVADRHVSMVADLLTDAQAESLRRDGSVSLVHETPHGTFSCEVRGPEGERMRFALAQRVEPPSPQPAPGPAETPPLPPVDDPPAAVVQRATAPPPQETAPVLSDALEQLLEYAAEMGASDLHLASGEPAVIRTDGRLTPLGANVHDIDSLVGPLLSRADRVALRAGGSVDRAVQTGSGRRYRANIYRCDQGMAAAFRVLRPAAPSLASLGLPADLSWIVDLPHGLVLFCGPTGSGKSTTMAALVREALQARRGLLITLEDPVEYAFKAAPGSLVRQREIGRHVADFPSGLRDALREDPDLILVGEMRDEESIQLALTAAETGHLVFASLHSRSATSAVERIVDGYPPERQRQIRVQLADALRAVVSQRLLPRADGSGRVAAVEVLKVNQPAENMIREGKTPQLVSVIQTGTAQGMVTMERCLRDLVRRGRITEQTATAQMRTSA